MRVSADKRERGRYVFRDIQSAQVQEDGRGNDPVVVILRPIHEKTALWTLAKSCRSTVQAICLANHLPPETKEATGGVLLIPVAGQIRQPRNQNSVAQ
jgi:hypothetical protein